MAKIEVKDINFDGSKLFDDSEDFMDALQEDNINGGGANLIDLNTDPIFIPNPCPHPTKPVLYPLPCLPLVL